MHSVRSGNSSGMVTHGDVLESALCFNIRKVIFFVLSDY